MNFVKGDEAGPLASIYLLSYYDELWLKASIFNYKLKIGATQFGKA
jgi:hypothetical protein